MSLLFKNLRVHQVFGANTDVGKTILTSGLVRASAAKNNRVFYLKPVSTGPIEDADDEYVLYISFSPVDWIGLSPIALYRHVNRYAGPHRALVNTHCLYRLDEPVSPHLAASMAAEKAGAQVSIINVLADCRHAYTLG
jgi:dethiobiotin synthetase/adenosylmethionine--8-amino-7-oxononanoate aminotransferase